MTKQMYLSGFTIFCPSPHQMMSWVYPREKIRHQWYEVEYWAEIARTLERGKFDMIFFADGWGISSNKETVRYAIQWPMHDPSVLIPYLAAVTENLGFAVTMSTTFFPPFMLARKLATMDHVTKGRIGWNIVNSIADTEARNFGMAEMRSRQDRYDRADEYMDVCNKLWSSWEDDALLMDMENGIFADPDKIHQIDFKGQYFDVQGPLTVIPSPQRRPYLFQAGQSPRGRTFAVDHAECIFAFGTDAAQMRDFCNDIAARLDARGRDPKEIKIMWAAQPIVADTESEARARHQEIRERVPFEASLALLSNHFDLDITGFDIDKPVGDLQVPGVSGGLEAYKKTNPQVTLREIAGSYLASADERMIGTAGQVADHMQYLLEEGGGDGFQITNSYYAPDYYGDLVDKLVPVLQKRGVFHRDYEAGTLRARMGGNRGERAAPRLPGTEKSVDS